jgi:hypothetical protein
VPVNVSLVGPDVAHGIIYLGEILFDLHFSLYGCMATFDTMSVGLYAVLCNGLTVLLLSWVSIAPEAAANLLEVQRFTTLMFGYMLNNRQTLGVCYNPHMD